MINNNHRILIISDVHGNATALRDLLDYESSIGFDYVFGLGDYVGYYPYVNEVVELIKVLPGWFVSGNHDVGVINASVAARESDYRWIDSNALLTRENRSWLENLQSEIELETQYGKFLLQHSWPFAMNGYLYPDTKLENPTNNPATFLLGHTHVQMARAQGGSRFINPGSVGQPRNGKPGCDYAVLEKGKVTFFHRDYDVRAASDRMSSWSSSLSIDLLLRSDAKRFDHNPCPIKEFPLN